MISRKTILTTTVIALFTSAFLVGCAHGENDPWFSIHSRDTRISQTWSLKSLSGSVVTTTGENSTNITYEFDGTTLYITTNDSTASYLYQYDMDVKDNGELFSQEFKYDINSGKLLSQSSKSSYWFWGDDDQNKTSVNLDLTGLLSAYSTYDIPRLAYSDMTLAVDQSDNSTTITQINDTTFVQEASSESSSFELMWEVNLDGL